MKSREVLKRIQTTIHWLVLLTASTGCRHEVHDKHEEKGTFQVTSPLRRDAEITREYVSQIRAIQHIDLRAQERGYLQGVFADEGELVKKGQKLFQVMPRLYQAELQRTEAETEFTQLEYQNTKLLADADVVSPNELALAKAKVNKARAEMALAKAHRDLTELKAPFAGIMGRFHVRLGSLLDEGELLSTLSDNSTVWVYFNVSETEYLNYMSRTHDDRPEPVRLRMANGEMFDQKGRVETIEADFNNETGNIAFRASFANPKGLLRHGETGTLLMSTTIRDALIIPQQATFDVLDKKYVFTVDERDVVRSREVSISHELPHLYIIDNGLTETDRILIDGIRKAHDGSEISVDFHQPADVLTHLDLPVQ